MITKKYEFVCDNCDKTVYLSGNKRQASIKASKMGWWVRAKSKSKERESLQYCSNGCNPRK